MAVIHIGSESEYNGYVSRSNKKLVVVDFFATWCGPCKMVEGPYENLSYKYSGANFLKVDVDQHQGISSTAGVTAMPTFQVYLQGELKGSVRGANLNELESIIMTHYKNFDSFSGAGNKLGSGPGQSSQPSAPNPFSALLQPNLVGPEVECELCVRTWDNKTLKHTFLSTDTLETVHSWVASLPGAPDKFWLANTFPRKIYQDDQLGSSLREEGLISRGQLLVKLNNQI